MQAVVQGEYGTMEVLRLEQRDIPVPADDQMLIKVHASSVNPFDWHMMTGTPYLVRSQAGLRRPKQAIAGADVAGTVEAIGKDIADFAVGDEVFGEISGAFAEYATGYERHLAAKPINISFSDAATVPMAGLTALQGVRDHAAVEPGQRVIVNGASGGVGIFAVQIAKELGAEVTAVCSSGNVEMVSALGADHVIDYTTEDFTTHAGEYDVLIDNIGNRSLSDCRRVLTKGGTYVMIGGPKAKWLGPVRRMLAAMVYFKFSSQKLKWFIANANAKDLNYLKDLMEAGKMSTVIDKRYGLSQVPEAIAYLAEGHTRGKSVIEVVAEPSKES